jgi:hypothetical protein
LANDNAGARPLWAFTQKAYIYLAIVNQQAGTMSLQKTIAVVAALADRGVIQHYAIAGAVAALNYIQPTLTEDLDILISTADFETHPSGLILLTPIEKALADMGYTERTDLGFMIDGWPVQFLPAASALDEEALARAIELEVDAACNPPLMARCLRAEYVVAIAIKLGRLKDLARVQAFLEQKAVDLVALSDVLERHNLISKWRTFCAKAAIADPLRTT